MDTTRKKMRAAIVLLLILTAALGAACVWLLLERRGTSAGTPGGAEKRRDGLFSWHDEVFQADERESLFRLMREQGLTELYQDVPLDLPAPQIRAFVEACRTNGVRPYLLVGAPEWALDRSGAELRAQIQRAALMGFAGVMADVEPGSTDEWKEEREPVMESMTEGFLRGKAAAEENGVELIVCLSYYYDDYGFDDELETIVERGCDALAIMNYDRRDEIGQIEDEAALCRIYGKRLIHIYEIQQVGKFDLEEIHTYREAGLPALRESFEAIRRAFPEQELSLAMHEYRALKEMA